MPNRRKNSLLESVFNYSIMLSVFPVCFLWRKIYDVFTVASGKQSNVSCIVVLLSRPDGVDVTLLLVVRFWSPCSISLFHCDVRQVLFFEAKQEKRLPVSIENSGGVSLSMPPLYVYVTTSPAPSALNRRCLTSREKGLIATSLLYSMGTFHYPNSRPRPVLVASRFADSPPLWKKTSFPAVSLATTFGTFPHPTSRLQMREWPFELCFHEILSLTWAHHETTSTREDRS